MTVMEKAECRDVVHYGERMGDGIAEVRLR